MRAWHHSWWACWQQSKKKEACSGFDAERDFLTKADSILLEPSQEMGGAGGHRRIFR